MKSANLKKMAPQYTILSISWLYGNGDILYNHGSTHIIIHIRLQISRGRHWATSQLSATSIRDIVICGAFWAPMSLSFLLDCSNFLSLSFLSCLLWVFIIVLVELWEPLETLLHCLELVDTVTPFLLRSTAYSQRMKILKMYIGFCDAEWYYTPHRKKTYAYWDLKAINLVEKGKNSTITFLHLQAFMLAKFCPLVLPTTASIPSPHPPVVETGEGVFELLSTRSLRHATQTGAVPVYLSIGKNDAILVVLLLLCRQRTHHLRLGQVFLRHKYRPVVPCVHGHIMYGYSSVRGTSWKIRLLPTTLPRTHNTGYAVFGCYVFLRYKRKEIGYLLACSKTYWTTVDRLLARDNTWVQYQFNFTRLRTIRTSIYKKKNGDTNKPEEVVV